MDYKTHQNRLSQLSARFNLMVCLVFCLMISNVSLSGFIWHVWHNHQIEITPFSDNSGYVKSANLVDANYLSLMSENFINERLNVTPETVDANHTRLLSFTDSSSYPILYKRLLKEARVIKAKKISSIFHIKDIKPIPNQMKVFVTGYLTRFVGLQSISELRITYCLAFKYIQGRLSILKFASLKEDEHV